MENIAFSHELARDLNKKVRGSNIILKLDLSKAYDRVKWSFLHETMRAFGFEEKWVDMIYRLLNNCWYSVRIQNQSFGFFKAGCGLRQGDPLSSSLFILVMDVLSRNLKDRVEQNIIKEFCCFRGAKAISHLLFADDILIFSNGSLRSVRKLKLLLDDFSLASGQVINQEKSRFYISDKSSSVQGRKIQQVLQFSIGSLPSTYLGVPLFTGRTKAIHFDYLLDKIRSRISGWRAKMLSWGGKVSIISSILNSIPIYTLSVLPVPKKVINQIQNSIADFLWNQGEQKRHHWISWNLISKPLEEGGLNLKLLADAGYYWKSNLAWNFIQKNSPWSHFMHQKYKLGISAATDSKIWRDIASISTEILSNSFWKIGKGTINFWSQKWWPMDMDIDRNNNLPDVPIKEIWNDDLRREEYISYLPLELQQYARDIKISNSEDYLIWKQSEDGRFSSKSFRLMQSNGGELAFPWWKKFWQDWIPTKCSCFLWKCLHQAVPVDESIQRTKISLASKCVCCINSQQESINHLFLFSDVAKEVWNFLHSLFDIRFHYLDIRQAANIWVNNSPVNSQFGCLKILAFVVSLWEIWKWRNKCIYEKPESSSSIKRNIVFQIQQCNFLLRPSKEGSWTEKVTISCLHLPIIKPLVRKGRWIKWSPNPQGFTLNFHGKIKENSGFGGLVIRNNRGNIHHCKGMIFPNLQDQFLVVILVLEEALSSATSKGVNLAEIQSDAGKVINCLSGKKSPPWRWIDRIAQLRTKCQGISLRNVERERNWAAVLLAGNIDSEGTNNPDVRKTFEEDRRGLPRWSWL